MCSSESQHQVNPKESNADVLLQFAQQVLLCDEAASKVSDGIHPGSVVELLSAWNSDCAAVECVTVADQKTE